MTVEFKILGKTRAVVDGSPVLLPRAKVRAILGLLMLHPNTNVSRSKIIRNVWRPAELGKAAAHPGGREAGLRNLVETHIKKARGGLRGQQAEIKSASDGYQLLIDKKLIDFHRFRAEVETARTRASAGEHAMARGLLADCVELWNDQLLEDLNGAEAERTRSLMIADHFVPACLALLDSRLALDEHQEAFGLLNRLVDEHPKNQQVAMRRLTVLAAVGRVDEAKEHYEHLVRVLVQEGVPVLAELRGLYGRLKSGGLNRAAVPGEAGRTPPPSAQDLTRPSIQQWPPNLLVGRERLLKRLDSLFPVTDRPQSGVVVLHGVGGVGKTALALTWVARMVARGRFADGQLFADLTGYSPLGKKEPAEVLRRFLLDFGIEPDRIPTTLDRSVVRLRELTVGRTVVVVLDNALDEEHVRPLLAALSGCLVLITSRNRFENLMVHGGADDVEVPQLDQEEAERLLRRVISESRPALDKDGLALLIERGKGIPLALRVIGARVKKQSRVPLAVIAREMRGNQLLDVGDKTSLAAVFSYSYIALAEESRRAFRLLGGHPGASFGVGVAAAVVDLTAAEVRRHLDVLVSGHLLSQGADDRYEFHDLIREYAISRLERDSLAPERGSSLRRMLDWYLLTARNAYRHIHPEEDPPPPPPACTYVVPSELDGVDQSLSWFSQEWENLSGAVGLAHRERLNGHAWRIVATFEDVLYRFGRAAELIPVLKIGIAAAREVREIEPEAEAGLLNNLAFTYMNERRYDEALVTYRSSYVLAVERGDRVNQALVLGNMAYFEFRLDHPDRAVSLAEESVAIYRSLGVGPKIGNALVVLGVARRAAGDFLGAARAFNEAARAGRKAQSLKIQGDALAELGALYYHVGDLDEAIQAALSAIPLLEKAKLDHRCGYAHLVVGRCHYARLEVDEAIRHYGAAVLLYRRRPDRVASAEALTFLAQALAAAGRNSEAEHSLVLASEVLDGRDEALDTQINTQFSLL
ncbi:MULTISPECIES: AfsR/SARP family transcriptional regulator [Actinoalloteichus]|uniref:DNA-binding transcriptional activator of the SARP family n=1 Tax=Actinoalloteichus fjordicus TaxID=1612552 RepID=A0AAC9LGV2_9PSEU|nr:MULTISPECIES: BTAD domain-containing putative transcriptional regulator [Actinoalloteichus]APU16629.1 DNA-binding transcriptional activator of the SARP family [Actinoalloteichus fjordicus]APU22695.1 DNA-binding transcriptional activator of the SARP family [Actinoalloteichus sp. GBA129-24]